MTAVPLEDLIARANGGGYRVNNLFQHVNGRWQANLRRDFDSGSTCFAFAVGGSPGEALEGAIRNAGIEEAKKAAKPAAVEVEDLLG